MSTGKLAPLLVCHGVVWARKRCTPLPLTACCKWESWPKDMRAGGLTLPLAGCSTDKTDYTVKSRLASNLQSSCFNLLSARIIDMCHHSSIIYIVYLIGHLQSYNQRMEAQRNIAFIAWIRSGNQIQVYLSGS